jgi:hypothetical protein
MDKNQSTPKFDLREFQHLLQYAIMGMGAELQKMQDNLIRRERFGNDVVGYIDTYHPGKKPYGSVEEDVAAINRVNELAQKSEALLEQVKDASFLKDLGGFMNGYFTKK